MANNPVITLEYRQKLEDLPHEQLFLLRGIADEAAARGLPIYLVGGFVRDLLLDRPSLDFDIVVEGDAVAVARALARKHGGKVTAHPRFGTATWFLDRGQGTVDGGPGADSRSPIPDFIDLITARSESYAAPAALPEVVTSTLDDDLRRRDFTINTLAVRLDGKHFGELIDLHKGKPDLEAGLVRVLHDASFVDDPTRIFRAVRYEQRYGFKIEPHTLKLLAKALPLIEKLSAERLRHELDLLFDEPRVVAMLARLEELGALKALALPLSAALRQRLEAHLKAVPAPAWGLAPAGVPFRRVLGYCLWLLDLSMDEIDALQARLAFPLAVLKPVRAAAALRAELPGLDGAKPSKWVESLDGAPLAAVYALYLVTGEAALESYALRWRHIRPGTDGEALKAMGVPPGPTYKKILLRLRAAWLDGEVASAEQEKGLLETLLLK